MEKKVQEGKRNMFKHKIEYLVYAWIFLLMFSNLVDRITDIKIATALFYGVFFILILASLTKLHFYDPIVMVSSLPIFFFFALIFHPSTPIKANIMSVKEFIMPITALWIGISLLKDRKGVLNLINYLFLFFICYGLFQEVSFYAFGEMAGLEKYLPWDYNYINTELNRVGGPRNFFQGPLLRFPGPMNSFIEGQVFVVVLLCVLLKNRLIVKNGLILKFNIFLSLLFLILALERTPVFMLMIILVVWNIRKFANLKFVLCVGTILPLIIMTVVVVCNKFQNDEKIQIPIKRIANVATLQLSRDAAIKERRERNWKQSIEYAENSFWGLGPARISASSRNMIDNYISTHNNFLDYYLGYGFAGLFFFLLLLITIVFYASKYTLDTKWFVWGIVASYLACAVFNRPFTGRNGILFFFTVGFVLAGAKLVNKKT